MTQSSEVSASPVAWLPGRLQDSTFCTIAAEFGCTAAPSVLVLNGELLAYGRQLAPGRLKPPKPSQPVLVPGEEPGPGVVFDSVVVGGVVSDSVVVGGAAGEVDDSNGFEGSTGGAPTSCVEDDAVGGVVVGGAVGFSLVGCFEAGVFAMRGAKFGCVGFMPLWSAPPFSCAARAARPLQRRPV